MSQEIQNGVKKPIKPSTKTYKLWEIIARISQHVRRPPTLEEVLQGAAEDTAEDYSDRIVKAAYRNWCKFYDAESYNSGTEVLETESAALQTDETASPAEEVQESVISAQHSQNGFSFDATAVAPLQDDVDTTSPGTPHSAEQEGTLVDPSDTCSARKDNLATVALKLDHLLSSGKVQVYTTQSLAEVKAILMCFIEENVLLP